MTVRGDGVNYLLVGTALLLVLAAIGWPLAWSGGDPVDLPQITLPEAPSLPLGGEAPEAVSEQVGPAMSWRVLAASYREQGDALQTLRKLRADGFAAYPDAVSAADAELPHRIYVEEFVSLAEAAELVVTLQQRYGLSAEPQQQPQGQP